VFFFSRADPVMQPRCEGRSGNIVPRAKPPKSEGTESHGVIPKTCFLKRSHGEDLGNIVVCHYRWNHGYIFHF